MSHRPPVRLPRLAHVRTTLDEMLDVLRRRFGDGAVEVVGANDGVDFQDATHDSREVRPGMLYCAIPGAIHDGHDFVDQAAAAGAAAALVQRTTGADLTQIVVPSVREAIGHVASLVHGEPSRRLTVVGVTGTNGKTTTCYLLEAALGHGALGTGVIGTIETRIHGEPQPGVRTTPEATDLQRLLATMSARGVDAVAMEVSSHGLHQHRVDATRYAVAVFTNLSQDHLDYHATMEDYFASKARLFTDDLAQRAVICVDDEWGRRLAHQTEVPAVTFGRSAGADVRIVDVVSDLRGTRCRLIGDGPNVLLRTRLLGEHNAWNTAAAYLAAREAGVGRDEAIEGLRACEGVPGRLERVHRGQPFAVLVDYAHTPDAIERIVETARSLADDGGRIIIVVGAGGDRDREKRPAMGRAAAAADRAVLTSDNPRTEDPQDILEAVQAGAREVAGAAITVEADRREAMRAALAEAGPGDVVLIAGKGHETTQEFADETITFDDREVAAGILGELGWDESRPRGAA